MTVGFLVLLLAPSLSMLWPTPREPIENRDLSPPEFTASALLRPDYYLDLLRYASRANPMQVVLARLGGGIDYWILHESPDPAEVFVGKEDWLFLQHTVRLGCATDPQLVADNLMEFIELLSSDSTRVVFTVAPSKVVIHDDSLTDRQWQLTSCVREKASTLRSLLASRDMPGYVDSWAIFSKRKDSGLSPYFRTDSHFDFESAIPWIMELVTTIESGVWSDSDVQERGPVRFEGNLMALLGLQLPEPVHKVEIERNVRLVSEVDTGYFDSRRYRHEASGPGLIGGKTIVLKDSFMDLPEPYLAQYFTDITFFDWRRSHAVSDFLEAAISADTIILETSEEGLLGRFSDRSLLERYLSLSETP